MPTTYVHAKFVTMSEPFDWMVVDDSGTIIQTGINPYPFDYPIIDLQGHVVFPGLHDSHLHVYSLGRSLYRLNLQQCFSIIDLQQRLKKYTMEVVTDEWLIGFGWDQSLFAEHRYPNRYDLDAVVNDRPVALYRACHHIAVLNSKALEMLKISATTDNPVGGVIDKENGEPTGIIRENALVRISEATESLSRSTREKRIMQGLRACLEVGLTAVHTNDAHAWQIYEQLARSNALPIRVFLTIPYEELHDDTTPAAGTQVGLLKADRIKLFADGSLGASTAAMLEGYSDNHRNIGVLIESDAQMYEKVLAIAQYGWRPEIHAIGDRGAQQVINTYAKIPRLTRPIITHAQILTMSQIHELAENNIVANIQPIFVPTDSNFAENRVGARIATSYAWKSLLDSGVVCAGGSDSPIESPNPLLGIYTAMYRRIDPTSKSWFPEQNLSFEQAVALFTTNAAFAAVAEDSLGKLHVGFQADFVVLADDVVADHSKLLTTHILQSYVSGQLVYSKSE